MHQDNSIFVLHFRKNYFDDRVNKFQDELQASLKPTDIQICLYDNWNKQFKVNSVLLNSNCQLTL